MAVYLLSMTNFENPPQSAGKDDEYYKQLTKYNIFKEAFQQDSEANRLDNSNSSILLTEIHDEYSASGTIEEYRREARGMAIKDNPLIEFVGDIKDDTIRITFNGRTYWGITQNRYISDLDL